MANIKSAKKRILQNAKRRIQNKSVRTETKTEVKKFLHSLATAKDKDSHMSQLRYVERILDKAVSKGVIHKNKSARLKSKLNIRFNTRYAVAETEHTKE